MGGENNVSLKIPVKGDGRIKVTTLEGEGMSVIWCVHNIIKLPVTV